jgi:hypothetical protein
MKTLKAILLMSFMSSLFLALPASATPRCSRQHCLAHGNDMMLLCSYYRHSPREDILILGPGGQDLCYCRCGGDW